LQAIALLVGALAGYYTMPVPYAVDDAVIREMLIILGPANVKVRRGAMLRQDNLQVGDALHFQHVPPNLKGQGGGL